MLSNNNFAIFMRMGLTIVVALFCISCTRQEGDPILNYFWPLKEGYVSVYSFDKEGMRTVKIAKITRKPSGEIKMETEEELKGLNLPLPSTLVRNVFHIVPNRNLIYLVNSSSRELSQQTLYLKGPIQEGVQWLSDMMVIEPFNPETPEKIKRQKSKGNCKIDNIQTKSVLGEDVRCAEVVCPVALHKVSGHESTFHCKGIGYIGSKSTVSFAGGQTESIWLEKIVEIREQGKIDQLPAGLLKKQSGKRVE